MTEPESATGPFLSDISPSDKPWDVHKKQSRLIQAAYAANPDFIRYSERMAQCSNFLDFAEVVDTTTGEAKLKLRRAQFCRVRYCGNCQWRRSMFWAAKFHEALPAILEDHPEGRFLYLVLTVKNCPITELRDMLRHMNESWRRMLKRPVFKHVIGWIRTTEVTKGKDDSAHPHFNVLLFVQPGYFAGKNYLSQDKWTELWRDVARLDYDPMVWIRAVRPKKKKGLPGIVEPDPAAGAVAGAKEVMKYSVKPADLIQSPPWLYELTRQTHHLRFLASGGCFKNAFRQEPTDEDLLHAGESPTPEPAVEELSRFLWKDSVRRYAFERKVPASHDVSLADRIKAKAAIESLMKPKRD